MTLPAERRSDRKYLFALITSIFLSTLAIGVFTFAFPLLALQRDMPGGWLGILFSGYFLAKLFLSPLAGSWADRYSPRPLLLAALCFGSLLPALSFFQPGHTGLYVIQFGLGLCAGIIKPVSLAAISGLASPSRHGQLFAWTNTATNIAFFLGPALGGLIFYSMQMERVLIFLASAMLLSLGLVFYFVPGRLQTYRPQQNDISIKKNSSGKKELFFAVFGRALGISALIVFFPILLTELVGQNKIVIGVIAALPSFTSCLLLPLGGKLADRKRRDILTLTGMSLSALALAFLGQATSLSTILIFATTLGMGTALSFPAAIAMGASFSPRPGKDLGLLQSASSLGFIIGPLVCGLAIQVWSSVVPAFAALGAMGLLSCLPLALAICKQDFKWRFLPVLSVLFLFVLTTGLAWQTLSETSPPETATTFSAQKYANLAMGGIVHLTMLDTDKATCDKAAEKAFLLINNLEKDFSHRTAYGSVGKINLAAGKKPVSITPEAFGVIERALKLGQKSEGAFDITIGAVTILPLYYREKASREKAALVDYREVILNKEQGSVFLPRQGMAIDLGGLAKGSIVDAAAAALQKQGVKTALIEASGDFYCYGEKRWRIGIQDPRAESLLGVIEVKNASVCGSGDYYQYTEAPGGERKHHILDPKELGSAHASIGVTVIAPHTELADALATTMFILGPQKGMRVLKKFPNCSALWVKPDRSLIFSPTFPPFLK